MVMNKGVIFIFALHFIIVFIGGKELQFRRYSFRKKSTWGKAVNRAERECKEDKCQSMEGNLQRDICIRKCISSDCYQELYAWNELEEGERDIRWISFKGCAAHSFRSKNDAKMNDL